MVPLSREGSSSSERLYAETWSSSASTWDSCAEMGAGDSP